MTVFTALAAGGLLLGLGTSALGAPATNAATTSHPISWLAAGDSYASGQGLPNPSGPCARGTGTKGSGSTWAVTAAYLLKEQGVTIAGGGPDLVACTGAISDQFFNADGAPADKEPQWKSPMKRYDLVTFSFGGDDIQFKSTITQCTIALGFCAPANTERNKITELGSTGDYVLGIHEPGYPTFLNHVANAAVVKGGNVIVMGYPLVFEKPSGWDKVLGTTCSGFAPAIIDRMRGWGSDLNATLGESVIKVNAEPARERNGVHFTFINPVTGGGAISPSDQNLFEANGSPHHELCSSGHQPWLNGFSANHVTHSYHPNQAGENGMGALAVEVISKLTWPWSAPVWRSVGQVPIPGGAAGPSVLSCASGPWCMAGYHNEAYVYSHDSWSKVAGPPGSGLGDLSCVTSSFCVGVYYTTTAASGDGTDTPESLYSSYATTWDGHGWSKPDELDHFSATEGYGAVQDVSCTAVAFCIAIGGDFGSAVWNGSSWRRVSGNTAGTDGGTGLSCTSATFCMATPAASNTIIWNGKQWGPGTQAVPTSTDWLSQVSCASRTLCLATGTTQATPYTFDGTSWMAGPAVQGQTGGPLSCARITYCVYSPSNGEVSEFSGTTWSSPQSLVASTDSDQSTLVSCAPTFCMATYENRAFLFSVNGPGTPVASATQTGASGSTGATSSPAPAGPLLGAHWCGEYCPGYGTSEPTEVFNGGDPTGEVSDITWSSWGGAEAKGSGTSTYVPLGDDVANGYPAPATIVAFDLGTCGDGPAYTAVEWYFPEFGGSFDPGDYIEACTGGYAGTGFGGTGNSGSTATGNTGASLVPQPTGNSGNTGTAATQPSPSGNSGNSGSTGSVSTGNSG